MSTPHVGDVGSIFRIRFIEEDDSGTIVIDGVTYSVVDISGAIVAKQIRFKKPSGSFVSQLGAFTTDGTDGELEYAMQTGDLDAPGTWWLDGLVEGSGFKYFSKKGSFEVTSPLS